MDSKHHHPAPRSHASACWLILAAIGTVLLGGILTHPDLAQSAQSQLAQAGASMRAVARRGMSEAQVVAMHAVLKRSKPTAPTEVDRSAAAESDSFNSDHGPGLGPIGPHLGL
jgi:hypothetical protein